MICLRFGGTCKNYPTRIPNSSPSCCCTSVTKTVKCRYLGNREWYHRSAGVKMTGKIFKYRNFKNLFKQTFKKKENQSEEEKINQSAQSRPEGPLPRSGAPEGALDFYPEYLPNPSTIKFSLKQNINKYKMKIVFVALPSGYRLCFKAQRTKGSPRNN